MKNRRLGTLLSIFMAVCILLATIAPMQVLAAVDPVKAASQQHETDTTAESEADESNQDSSESIGQETVIDWQTIEISTAEELIKLVNNCRLDSWSRDKYIKLTDDIHLAGKDFVPFATFGGIFDGNGHTIDGFNLTTDMSYLGFFSKIQPSGIVRNLIINGNVTPESKVFVVGGIAGDNYGRIENCSFKGLVKGNDYTGAIAGYNENTGTIFSCESFGTVLGQHYTGGIAGTNCGGIYQCVNSAKINTSNIDRGLSIEDISVNQYLSAFSSDENSSSEGKSLDSANNTFDTGGIAGHSSGIVEFCTNNADVGYERVGYNTGGIVGRQSGYVHGCINEGTVQGRKDTAGIVGQAEPNVVMDLSDDIISELNNNINELHDYVDKTLTDMDNSSDTVTDRLNMVKRFVDGALDDTSYLGNDTINFVNGLTGAGNEALSRVDYAVDEAGRDGGAIDDTKNAMSDVSKASDNLQNAVNASDVKSKMSESDRARYDNDIQCMEDASKEHQESYNKVYRNNYNYYIYNDSKTTDVTKSYKDNETDLHFYIVDSDGNEQLYDTEIASLALNYNTEVLDIRIYHGDDKTSFPATEGDQATYDADLIADATSDATGKSNAYADDKFNDTDRKAPDGTDMHAGTYTYSTYITKYADDLVAVVEPYAREAADEARPELESAASNLSNAANNLAAAADKSNDIFDNLSSRADITLPVLSDSYKAHTNSFVANLQGMSEHLGYLNNEMNSSSDTVVGDMQDVNDSFNKIMLLFTDAIDGALDGEYAEKFTDDSFAVAEECIDGAIVDCVNNGKVSGDLDVGGIAGTMGIEYDFDLEGDITGNQDSKINSTFKTKCVLRANINNGRISSQKSYVAGVCGLQDMGTILHSENYGSISSKTADYVGGIVGSSISSIKECYSKGIMSGKDYIGGIAGYGHDIYECYTIPSIIEYDSFAGAIAGEVDDNSTLKDNYFVSDALSGVDRISYSKMAEPLTYKEMMKLENVPDEFKYMQVSFLIDDEVVGRKTIEYGHTMVEDQYPDSVAEEDYYIDWDTSIVHDVTTDMEVIGEPALYRTTIASKALRENKQSVILVDGKFKDSQTLEVTRLEGEDDSAIITADGELLQPGTIAEHYEIIVPDDGMDSHQFRVQLPEDVKKAEIYVKASNGRKNQTAEADSYYALTTSVMGMYQLFDVSGSHVTVLIVDKTIPIWKYIVAVIGVLVLALIIILLLVKKHGKNKNKKASRKIKRAKRAKKKEQAREAGKVFIEDKIEKAQQLLEDAKDDSPRGEKKEENDNTKTS